MRKLGFVRIHESTGNFIDCVERCLDVGLNELILGYLVPDELVSVFEEVAIELILQLGDTWRMMLTCLIRPEMVPLFM